MSMIIIVKTFTPLWTYVWPHRSQGKIRPQISCNSFRQSHLTVFSYITVIKDDTYTGYAKRSDKNKNRGTKTIFEIADMKKYLKTLRFNHTIMGLTQC